MAKGTNALWGLVVGHFEALQEHIIRVNPAAQFVPNGGYDVFKPNFDKSTDEVVHFEIGPVLVNVPERGQLSTNDLFVVFVGRIAFDAQAGIDDKRLVTRGFASKVGYFTRKKQALDHVYGAHYDLDTERVAHPAFHAQLESYSMEFLPHVRELGRLDLPVENDRMVGMLQNVRVPIAQLDFFALLVQLVADHLIWEESGDEERQVFDDLVKLDNSVQGITPIIQSLRAGAALPCHRGAHWYARAGIA